MGIVEDMSKKQSVAGGGKGILQLESKMNGYEAYISKVRFL